MEYQTVEDALTGELAVHGQSDSIPLHVKIYGVVLNDADMKATDSYYYYSSHYTSYYGKEGAGRDV